MTITASPSKLRAPNRPAATEPQPAGGGGFWEARLLDYQLARILADANDEFGPHADEHRLFDNEQTRLAHEYGSFERARQTPDGEQRADKAWQRMKEADDANTEQYYRPMWRAANALVLTPAPDLVALKIKIEVIKLEEVWNDATLEGDCWEIVQADVARLRPNMEAPHQARVSASH